MTVKRFIIGFVLTSLLAISINKAKAANWDSVDKALFTGQIVLQVTDILQTNYVKKHPEKFREANPLYGEDPNMLLVIGVKSLLVTGLYWIVRDMPSVDRKVVLGVADVIQLSIVGHNFAIGVKVGF